MALLSSIAYYLLTGLSGALVVLAVDFLRRPRSRFISWGHALVLYLAKLAALLISVLKWRQYVSDSKRLEKVQEQFVLEQIRANADTAYGRDHSFSSIDSLEEFRRSQPLTTYTDYEPYIQRTEKGDYAAMFGDGKPPQMFGCSSGTTGKSKKIPVSSQSLAAFGPIRLGVLYGSHADLLAVDPLLMMSTFCAPRWRHTEAGVRIGSVMASIIDMKLLRMSLTLPEAALDVGTEDAALYIGLLFGLRDADVSVMQGSFASSLFQMLQYLESNWRQIVQDLRRGSISEGVKIAHDVRQKLSEVLKPEPGRAAQLEREFSKGFGGIMSRIFPRLGAIFCNHSGSSMGVYRRRCLPYLGGVPLYSHIYVSTEGLLGVNVRGYNERPGYALLPRAAYMEFLPVDEDGQPLPDQGALQASELQEGGRYEVVVTNNSGFYRYRLGDIVEVVGFFNQVPLIDFLFRSGQMLNVHMEKMTEASFTHALQAAAARWCDVSLDHFAAAEDVLDTGGQGSSKGPPHYLLFLETSGGEPTTEQSAQIDEQLRAEHYVYKSFRVKDAIGPMQVISVAAGTFQQYQAHILATTGAFASQFKQPRVLRTPAQVEFFMQRRLRHA